MGRTEADGLITDWSQSFRWVLVVSTRSLVVSSRVLLVGLLGEICCLSQIALLKVDILFNLAH